MTGYLVRIGFLLLALGAGMLGLASALAYDPAYIADLRAFLLADVQADCTAPCFLGIQPGVTPSQQVASQLRAHRWVAEVRIAEVQNEFDAVDWTWGDTTPPYVQRTGRVNVWHGSVDWVRFQAGATAAEIWLALGPPARVVREHFDQRLLYPQYALTLTLSSACRGRWQNQPFITYVIINVPPAVQPVNRIAGCL